MIIVGVLHIMKVKCDLLRRKITILDAKKFALHFLFESDCLVIAGRAILANPALCKNL